MASNYVFVGIALVVILLLTWLRFRLHQKAHAQYKQRAGVARGSVKASLRVVRLRGHSRISDCANARLLPPICWTLRSIHVMNLHETILADLQCNILTGHGRDNARFLFVKIDAAKADQAKNWLADFARNHVTSALKQKHQRTLWREAGLDGGAIAHIALSASGYRKLGFAEASLPEGTDPFKRRQTTGYRNAFATGMKARQPYLLDPAVADWEAGYRDDIDVMILLADDDVAALESRAKDVAAAISSFAIVQAVETGQTVHRKFNLPGGEKELGVEHFGFVDGRSQPLTSAG